MNVNKIAPVFTNLFFIFAFSINVLAAPGDLDPTFDLDGMLITPVGEDGRGVDVEIQSDGKIIAVGDTAGYTGSPDIALVRYNPDGTLDTGFGTNGIARVFETRSQNSASLLIQSDGKYVVVGTDFDKIAVYRFNSNGSLDTNFGTAGKFLVPFFTFSLARGGILQPDGKIIVVGQSYTQSIFHFTVLRLNTNGTLDTSFNGTGYHLIPGNIATSVALQNDGKIVVVGNGNGNNNITWGRFNSDGTIEGSLINDPLLQTARDVAIQSDGKIIIVGYKTVSSNTDFAVARYNPDKTLDTSFGYSGFITVALGPARDRSAMSIVIQPNGQFYVGGFMYPGSYVLTRFNSNGLLDLGFGNSGKILTSFAGNSQYLSNIALQTDGKIVAIGYPGVPGFGLARYLGGSAPIVPSNKTPFDFNGDHRADVSVFRPSSQNWFITSDLSGSYYVRYIGTGQTVIVPADFDGDGKTDPAVFSGTWTIYQSSTNTLTNAFVGQSGDIPVPGDYDGDGKADAAVFRNGVWSYRSSNYGLIITTQFGLPTDKPVAEDYDGDGKTDFAVYRPSVGDWYVLRSSDGGFWGVHFGISTDIPVPADFDGDGKTDISVYRPSAGDWYRLNSSDLSFAGVHFGISTDIPVAADYDGDGKSDIAVYRPSTSFWYLLQSTAGFGAIKWGTTNDIPTPSAFLR